MHGAGVAAKSATGAKYAVRGDGGAGIAYAEPHSAAPGVVYAEPPAGGPGVVYAAVEYADSNVLPGTEALHDSGC